MGCGASMSTDGQGRALSDEPELMGKAKFLTCPSFADVNNPGDGSKWFLMVFAPLTQHGLIFVARRYSDGALLVCDLVDMEVARMKDEQKVVLSYNIFFKALSQEIGKAGKTGAKCTFGADGSLTVECKVTIAGAGPSAAKKTDSFSVKLNAPSTPPADSIGSIAGPVDERMLYRYIIEPLATQYSRKRSDGWNLEKPDVFKEKLYGDHEVNAIVKGAFIMKARSIIDTKLQQLDPLRAEAIAAAQRRDAAVAKLQLMRAMLAERTASLEQLSLLQGTKDVSSLPESAAGLEQQRSGVPLAAKFVDPRLSIPSDPTKVKPPASLFPRRHWPGPAPKIQDDALAYLEQYARMRKPHDAQSTPGFADVVPNTFNVEKLRQLAAPAGLVQSTMAALPHLSDPAAVAQLITLYTTAASFAIGSGIGDARANPALAITLFRLCACTAPGPTEPQQGGALLNVPSGPPKQQGPLVSPLRHAEHSIFRLIALYSLVFSSGIAEADLRLTPEHRLALLLAALGSNAAHVGLSNHALTSHPDVGPGALYGKRSPQQRFSAAQTVQVISMADAHGALGSSSVASLAPLVLELLLSGDMSRHHQYVENFAVRQCEVVSFSRSASDVKLALMILFKLSELSLLLLPDTARGRDGSRWWALQEQEWAFQGRLESVVLGGSEEENSAPSSSMASITGFTFGSNARRPSFGGAPLSARGAPSPPPPQFTQLAPTSGLEGFKAVVMAPLLPIVAAAFPCLANVITV